MKLDTGTLKQTKIDDRYTLHIAGIEPTKPFVEKGYRHMPTKAQDRNLLQEVVMWLIGIMAAFVVAMTWEAVERVTGLALGYQNAFGLFIVALGGGWFIMSKVRNTEWGVIRKGIIYGAIVGVWFAFGATALSHVAL